MATRRFAVRDDRPYDAFGLVAAGWLAPMVIEVADGTVVTPEGAVIGA